MPPFRPDAVQSIIIACACHFVFFVALRDEDVVEDHQAAGRLLALSARTVAKPPIFFDDIEAERVMHVFPRHEMAVFRCCMLVPRKNDNVTVLKPT